MNAAHQTIAALLDPVLAAHPRTADLELTFEDITVAVTSNSPDLIARLAGYYRDFLGGGGAVRLTVTAIESAPVALDLPFTVKAREPGKTKHKEAYVDLPDGRVVHKLLTGLVFFFGHGVNAALGPCLANDNQIINFINNRVLEVRLRAGDLLLHAAGVAEGERGLAIAGFSGAGKSTLALQIMRHGTDFVSNDRIMVSRTASGLTMRGLAKLPRVNPGTVLNNPSLAPVMDAAERQTFAALPPAELWDLEHKYDASIDACFGPGHFRLSCPMVGLAVLTWRREPAPLVCRVVALADHRALLAAFMKDPGVFYDPDDPSEEAMAGPQAYLDRLGDLPVLEITGGVDFEAAARICLDFLRHPQALPGVGAA